MSAFVLTINVYYNNKTMKKMFQSQLCAEYMFMQYDHQSSVL